MNKKLSSALKAIDLQYHTPKFNHDIISHYHVAWKFYEGSLHTIEQPGEEHNIDIHIVIDLKDCIPLEKDNIPDCIINGIMKILNDEEDMYEMMEKSYEGL